MNFGEFAFFNQQLAAMLKSGIPLETALRQLCVGMRRHRWPKEFEQLERDLSQGIPLGEALDARNLPDLYKQMVKVGAKTNDLPALLTLVADHYQKNGFLWTRLNGLMLYPVIVLLAALALSVLLTTQGQRLAMSMSEPGYPLSNSPRVAFFRAGSLMPVFVLGALVTVVLLLLIIPPWRAAARWVLPGFKDAHLARLASSLNILLKSGVDLGSALALMGRLETGNRIAGDLALWERKLSSGVTRISGDSLKTRAVTPLFLWLVASEGEDIVAGLARAAEVYYRRAVYKTDLLLNSALPVSILTLGVIVIIQLYSTFQWIFNSPWTLFNY